MERQLSIDFDRARQLCLIKDWRPVTVDRVSGTALKAVLAQINQYGRGRVCFVSQSRLGQECGIHERTCRRAIAVLQSMGILIAVRTHAAEGSRLTTNQYRIVWSQLAVIVERQGRYQSALARESTDLPDASAGPSDTRADQRDTRADRWFECQGQTDLPDTSAGPSDTRTDQRDTRADQFSKPRCPNRPDTSADQQGIRCNQQGIRYDQQGIRRNQQDTGVLLHCITLPETNYTAPLPPKVDPEPGGRMAAEVLVLESPGQAAANGDGLRRPAARDPRAPAQPSTAIERLLADAGVELWARCAAEFEHLGPEVIQAAIATYRANRAKLRGPQAIVYALRNGIWPARGMAPLKPPDPPDVQRARLEQEKQLRLAQSQETLRYEIIVAGRRKKLSDREIGQRLAARGLDPEGFLEDQT